MNKTVEILNDTECNILLSALRTRDGDGNETVKGIRNHLIALLMLDAGLRVGEAVSLRVGDLFVMEEPVGMIRVASEKKRTATYRDIPVTIKLNNAIAEYAERVWVQRGRPSNWYAFKRTDTMDPISTRQVERIIRKAANDSLHRDVHPHLLRHTFATRLMTKCSIRVVQQLLGHESISSTQVYQHPNSKDLQKAIDTLNGACEETSGQPVS